MSHRAWWLVIATLVLLGVALVVHEATRPAPDGASPASAPAVDAPGAGAANSSGIAIAGAAPEAERNAAFADAVTTLHAYVAVLFKEDRSDADDYWLDGRPAASGESDLRALPRVTGIRLDNERPEPLDTAAVPEVLQIPVRLRVGGQGPLRHYAGHYRLRRVGEDWRITSASIEPSSVPR